MKASHSRNWKRVQPTSLRHALELCKEYARERRNVSIEGIAVRMGVTDHWTIYKWIQNGRIPANMVHPYEMACGINFVTRFMAASDNKLLIEIPTGRALVDADVVELHNGFGFALQLLTDFYSGKADAGATTDALMTHLNQVAFHHANVIKHAAPEFQFDGPVI
ncbi:hypothetical protein [Glaciimonas immobilis]|uniref:Uncharacterized protein n=1 Tax=Glaciimonas immobilis TaxID=728004 RepID=A0A840RNE5_9BURK|nr:hypothetical protein [Glaciimonas immobilis]KAF3999041.1 hypothetical protein HAV38_03595 [Glaciimonas immobilis]MBB5198468.1 hypothetical protein [Glaciimonas immobilis]